MLGATAQRIFFPEIPEYAAFLSVSAVSTTALLLTSLFTAPTTNETLVKFYTVTRPFGFWGPVQSQLPSDVVDNLQREHRRDLASLAVAVPWQLTLFLFMMQIVMKQWTTVLWLGALVALFSYALWKLLFRENSMHPFSPTPSSRP